MKIAAFAQIIGVCAMNNLPNIKIAALQDTLSNIDKQLTSIQGKPQENETRALIDKRRQVLARLQREMDVDPNFVRHPVDNIYTTNPQVQRFINTWCARIKQATQDIVSFENTDFCNLFIDHILPQKWHFDNDVIIVILPPSDHIIKALKDRGQNHVVTYFTDSSQIDVANAIEDIENNYICTSPDELERLFALLQTPAQQVVTLSCEASQVTSKDLKQTIIDAVNAGKKTRFENTRTVSKFGQAWATNVIQNLLILKNAANLHEMRVTGVEDAVIVGSGPSLNKNVNQLCEIQDKVFIVTALRSLPVLNDAGVKPDLVVQLDAEDDEVAKALKPDPKHPITNFLVEATINPGFLKIPAQKYIWSLAQHYFDIHQKLNTKPTPFNVPSVSIYALSLCHHLKFKNICFIGMDLAASKDEQYAKGATNLLPAHSNLSMFNIQVPGYNGINVMTRNSFHYQIKRCTELAAEWKKQEHDIDLINATEGGAYIDGFKHMSLEAYAKERSLVKLNAEKRVSFTNDECSSLDNAADYVDELLIKMDRVIKIAKTIIKLDSQPIKTRGQQKKIQKIVQRFKTINDSSSILQIAMQNNIAKVVGTSESGQKIGTFTEFFQDVLSNAITIKKKAEQAQIFSRRRDSSSN